VRIGARLPHEASGFVYSCGMARTDPRPNYGSKRRIGPGGYVDIYDPQHPLARADGYISEHRKVAWEAGMLTDPSHHVHHKNHRKDDNRVENLEVKPGSVHALDHVEDRGWVTNQYGTWSVKPRDRRVSAPRPVRPCLFCGVQIPLSKRRDAKYCCQACNMRAFKLRRTLEGVA